MTIMYRIYILLLVLLQIIFSRRAFGQDFIINLNSLTSSQKTLQLAPGFWRVTPINASMGGAYTAWNPWGNNFVRNCDLLGANCIGGWTCQFNISSQSLGVTLKNAGLYSSPALAFTNASDYDFYLTYSETVSFYIYDSYYGDNYGGVSLKVYQLPELKSTVSNVTAFQRTDGSGVVDIHYTLAMPDNKAARVCVQVSDDGGQTWNISPSPGALSGDFGSGIKTGNRHIIWKSKIDQPGIFKTNFRIKISADDESVTVVPFTLVMIPGGTFQMGDSLDEMSRSLPFHAVTLSPFYMGKYPITNQQYCEFLNSAHSQNSISVINNVVYKSGSGTSYPYCDTYGSSTFSQINWNGNKFSVRTKGGRSMVNDPMVRVSWYGAAAYCNWKSLQEGKQPCYNLSTWVCDFNKNGYRLPTEAQWEYAARGGLSGKRFPLGDNITHSQANYWSNSSFGYDTSPTYGYHPAWNDGTMPYTSPVGSFAPNGYGLYDVAGNVWEWCYDWYDSYTASSKTDPAGPASGSYRIIRGGSWDYSANNSRAAVRNSTTHMGYPSTSHGDIGFRIVLPDN